MSRPGPKFDSRPPISRKTMLYVAALGLSSMMLGTGVNLLLFREGFRIDPSIDVIATVKSCGDLGACSVTYEHNGKIIEGTYFLQGQDPPYDGSKINAVVYPKNAQRLYSDDQLPLPLIVGLVVGGFASLTFFGFKLYRHWRELVKNAKPANAKPKSGRATAPKSRRGMASESSKKAASDGPSFSRGSELPVEPTSNVGEPTVKRWKRREK